MLTAYINEAMRMAHYELGPDARFLGEIPGLPNVSAKAETLEQCRQYLQVALEQWLVQSLSQQKDIPALGSVKIEVQPLTDESAAQSHKDSTFQADVDNYRKKSTYQEIADTVGFLPSFNWRDNMLQLACIGVGFLGGSAISMIFTLLPFSFLESMESFDSALFYSAFMVIGLLPFLGAGAGLIFGGVWVMRRASERHEIQESKKAVFE
ncbi:MAG: hypothetical protein SGI88_01065 [Candidatus Hydrogenedentes bacterium]|nr:hypothetical protein [Candidatus Hydrogenedentota bacterium]